MPVTVYGPIISAVSTTAWYTSTSTTVGSLYIHSFTCDGTDNWDQRRCEYERQRQDRAVAYKKAEDWLMENLSDEQRDSYSKELFFEVIGSESRRMYRVRRGLSGVRNVQEMKKAITGRWKIARTLCFHPAGDLPEGDILLTQKVLLERDEEYVRKVANFS